jgi:hypothetical protein
MCSLGGGRTGPPRFLSGGIVRSLSGSTVLTVVVILMLAHFTLAALMWTDVIQFSSSDSKVIVATTLTVIAVLLLAIMMAIGFSNNSD